MDMPSAIKTVIEKKDLDQENMTAVMRTIMSGEATPAQIGGFLVGLRMKGETVEEIASAAQVMRDLAERVIIDASPLVDTCGTGGDGASTFNISTASAFVVAAAGGYVAKHGNRSISSKSGSADVLEAAGVKLDLSPLQVADCVKTLGVGFMFAPMHHGAMKHAIGPRREMGVRTLFNVLGPLTNPAGAPNQVLGVFSRLLVEPMARVLKKLGSHHVLVVHAEDGMDEVSIQGKTHVAELKDGQVTTYSVSPSDFGLPESDTADLAVESAQESLAVIKRVLSDQSGPEKDIVVMNAGAAIYAAGLAESWAQGVTKAQVVISEGVAMDKFKQFIAYTNKF